MDRCVLDAAASDSGELQGEAQQSGCDEDKRTQRTDHDAGQFEDQGDEEQNGGDDGEHGGLLIGPGAYRAGPFLASADLSSMHLTQQRKGDVGSPLRVPSKIRQLVDVGTDRGFPHLDSQVAARRLVAATDAHTPARTRYGYQ
jgi:hypothetical protein